MRRPLMLACLVLLSTTALAGTEERKSRRDARLERIDDKEMQRLRSSFEQRALRHHPFVEPLMSDSAFPTTHVVTESGAGFVMSPTVDEDMGEAGVGGYLAMVGRLGGGVRLGKWVGLVADIRGIAGVGGEAISIEEAGAQASYEGTVGVVVRLFRSEKSGSMLSIRPKFFGSGVTALMLGPGVAELTSQADEGDVDMAEVGSRMARSEWGAGGGASLNYAQALGRRFGMQGSLEGRGERQGASYNDGEDQSYELTAGAFGAGVAFSFDANPVPLALQLAYRYDHVFTPDAYRGMSGGTHGVGLGFYLNGLTNTIGLTSQAAVAATGGLQVDGRLIFAAYF